MGEKLLRRPAAGNTQKCHLNSSSANQLHRRNAIGVVRHQRYQLYGAVSRNSRHIKTDAHIYAFLLKLRRKPTHDYNVDIQGGIGEATVHLPSSAGIVADAAGGIGNIDVHGLEKNNGRWTNAAYGHSPVTIHLDVKGGIGNITLTAE